ENPKTALLIRGSSTSQLVNEALLDLCHLKRPQAVYFRHKNSVHPFEDDTSLQFLCKKNDSSLFVVGTHSKKRPHNLVLGRTFDGQILDMVELGMASFAGMKSFAGPKCAVGMKPCMVFNGELWDQVAEYRKLKNMLLDFFCGEKLGKV